MSFFSNRRQNQTEVRKEPTTISSASVSLTQRQPIGFETVLGANSVLEGTLESRANIRLDGIFTGILKITGNVLVGETAEINADINAKNVSIAGAVRGNVSGKKVQLLRTAKVWGDITATALTTEEGAFIDGKISMNAPQSEATSDSNTETTETALESDGSVDEATSETDETEATTSDESSDADDTAIVQRATFDKEMAQLNTDEHDDSADDTTEKEAGKE